MAFGRIIEFTVGEQGTENLISSGQDGLGLDISFKVERSNTLSENSAEIIVYNCNKTTREDILKNGNNLILKAGYRDQGIGTIFIGNITDSKSVLEGPDWITTITCMMYESTKKKKKVFNTFLSENLSLSYKAGTPISSVISDIADSLGLAVNGLSNANIKLKNGFVIAGNVKGALRQIKLRLESNGISLYKDNDELIVYKVNEPSFIDVTIVGNQSKTLINVEEVTEISAKQKARDKILGIKKRIKYTCALIPSLRPGAISRLDSENVNGNFVNEKVSYTGHLEKDFICECEAIG